MVRNSTISVKVEPDIYEAVKNDAEVLDISLSQWMLDAIDDKLSQDDEDWDELLDMSFDELVDYIDEYELDVDPDEFRGLLSNDADGLRDAIADELGLEYEEEE